MLNRIMTSLLLGASLASAASAQAPTPPQSHAAYEQAVNARNQARLDQKYGRAPEGRWWDEYGRLCRTDQVKGAGVRRCEKPDAGKPDNQTQVRLDKKFGRAPQGHWWDEHGKLCRTDRVGTKDVRRCEDPRPGQVGPV